MNTTTVSKDDFVIRQIQSKFEVMEKGKVVMIDCPKEPIARPKVVLQKPEFTPINPEIADLKNWKEATPIKYILRKSYAKTRQR